MKKVHCKDCFYFREIYSGGGECRRTGPKVFKISRTVNRSVIESYWPPVVARDWCGQGVLEMGKRSG